MGTPAFSQRAYDALLEYSKNYGGVYVTFKDEEFKWKLLAYTVLFFMRRKGPDGKSYNSFMVDFITIGLKSKKGWEIAVPDREYYEKSKTTTGWKVLAHELVHVFDKEASKLMDVLYLMPQLLGTLAGLALLAFWWTPALWALAFLVCAAPLPAYWRMDFEMRGYAMSMAVNYWRYGSISERTKTWVCGQFTGPSYYWMWPFKARVRARVDDWAARIESGAILDEGEVYRDVYEIVLKLKEAPVLTLVEPGTPSP